MKFSLELSRVKKLPVLWPYIILFGFLFILFVVFFYMRAMVLHKLGEFGQFAAKNGVILQGADLSFFPPSLQIRQATGAFKSFPLSITDIEIVPIASPQSFKINCNFMGGTVKAQVFLSSFLRPEILKTEFEGTDLPMKTIAGHFAGGSLHISVLGGLVDFHGQLERGKSWQIPHGNVTLALKDAELETSLPVLKKRLFRNVFGEANLVVEGRRCAIHECFLNSGNDSLALRGTLDGWQKPSAAQLNIDLSFRINPADLETSMIPERMLAKIRKDGVITAHIGQTLANPRLKVEN